MSPEEAHEGANMIREVMGVSPTDGKFYPPAVKFINGGPRGEVERAIARLGERVSYLSPREMPLATDYDEALNGLEELKKLAEEEPATKKVMMAFARLGENARYLVALTFGLPPNWEITHGRAYARAEERHYDIIRSFESAAGILKELKRNAIEFELERLKNRNKYAYVNGKGWKKEDELTEEERKEVI